MKATHASMSQLLANPFIRTSCISFFALSSFIALSSTVDMSGSTLPEQIEAVFPIEGGQGILFCLLILWFKFILNKLADIKSGELMAPSLLSGCLAICITLGRSLNELGNFSFILKSPFYAVVALLSFLGFFFLLCPLFARLFLALDHAQSETIPATDSPRAHLSHVFWRYYASSFCLILLCWLPYIIIGFPGSTSNDFIQQLRQYWGSTDLTNHHPIMMTFLLGVLFKAGYVLGGSNLGLFVVSGLQTLSMVATLSCCYTWVRIISRRKMTPSCILAFFALCPILPMYAQWCVKDTLSAVLLANFIMQVSLKLYFSYRVYTNPYFSWIAIAISGCLCSLSRNNCALIVIPTLLVLALILKGRQRRSGMIRTMALLVFSVCWSGFLLPALNIQSGSISEALSLPLLQTTRCVDLNLDTLSERDKSNLQGPCVVSLEELPQYYSIQISDAVKSRYSFEGNELANYISTYVSLGLQFPKTYTNVALSKTFGYWYPAATDGFTRFWYEYAPFTSSVTSPDLAKSLEQDSAPNTFKDVVDDMHSAFSAQKMKLRSWIICAANMPLVMLLFSPGFYFWINFSLCIYLLSRRSNMSFLTVPILMIFLICCLSPLNGSIRYALPLVFTAPFLLGMAVSPRQHRNITFKEYS